MKTLVILATEHAYQEDRHFLNADYELRLTYLCNSFGVQIVMEEWTEERQSFAKRFADGKVKYANIGTPDEERFRSYGFAGLIHHPGHWGTLPHDPEAPWLCEYGPYNVQENREAQMVKNIRAHMSEHNAGLVVIGLAHTHSMMGKLCAEDFKVAAYTWLNESR